MVRRLQGVNENANSLVTKLNSLDNDTKNNSQTTINLQEFIYIRTEQVKKVVAERQQAEAKKQLRYGKYRVNQCQSHHLPWKLNLKIS